MSLKNPVIQIDQDKVVVGTPVISYKDGNLNVIYCPFLDLYGYGHTLTEAKKSFQIVLEEFLKFTIEKNTLVSELKRLGWKIYNNDHMAEPPDICEIISKNENFHDLWMNKVFKKYNTSMSVPV
jgi:hypothetical protein